jgi:DNA mismatch repair protein MutS
MDQPAPVPLVDEAALLGRCEAARPAPVPTEPSAVETRLAAVNADELSPRAALDLVYELKALLRSS